MLDTTDTIFQHLDQDKGLASPVVSAFAEDGEGFLWIGTQSGASRWDGYRLRTYQTEVGVTGSLPDNIVRRLFTDSQGRMWVGTNSGGLASYDSEHDRFTSYPEDPRTGNHGRVSAIIGDGGRGLWIGTDLGLDHFDPQTVQFTHFHHSPRSTITSLDGKRVTALLRDNDGRLWLGTSSGLFHSDTDQKNFLRASIRTPREAPASVLSLLRDSAGAIWIGTLHGAFLMRSGETVAVPVHETGNLSPLDDQSVSSMVEAQKGVIWLGTYGQGIVAVNTKTAATHRIQHDVALPSSLSEDTVATLYRDYGGTVWAGTRRGASSANVAQSGIWTIFGGSNRKEGITGADVLATLALSAGRTWLGVSNQGIEIFNASWVRERSLRPDPAAPNTTLPQGTVNAMAETPEGKVYIGTSRGLYRTNRDGTGLAHVPLSRHPVPKVPNFQGQSPEVNVSSALYDAGRLWIGTDDGLWSLRSAKDSSLGRVLLHDELTDSRIVVLCRGPGEDLWVGTESGLNRVDLRTMAVEKILPDPQDPAALGSGLITSMIFDSRGRLWVATMGGGINVLEGRNQDGRPIFRRLTEGLPDSNVDTLLKAEAGTIWAATDDGLATIDVDTLAVRPLQRAEGLGIMAYWNNVATRSENGTLVFGGVGGITLIQPLLLKPWTFVPQVVVTNVRVGGKQASGGHGGSAADPIKVKSESNRVAVEFAALDYSAPDQNHYAYRLEGYDKEWVATDATQRLASYTNLPPGKYTLLLRGSNRMGLWAPARRVYLRVLPAWYETLWFHILAAILVLLLFVGVYQVATAVSRHRQRELERQVAVRTAELKQMASDLQASQLKLEKLAFTDSLTGLPNRRMFGEHFRRMLSMREREPGTFALLMLDLDGFKGINDGYGHDAGDAVLKAVASRLQPEMRSSDCLARLGGDEFSILLSGPIDAAGVTLACQRMLRSFADPIVFKSSILEVSLSIGVVFYPAGGTTQHELYKSADLALYRAKRGGKNRWSW